jgi:hypothetical protein
LPLSKEASPVVARILNALMWALLADHPWKVV